MAKTINKQLIGEQIHKLALSFAAKTGTAIDLAVVTAANAKHEFSLGPIKLYNAIMANLSDEERDMLPNPGSKWNDPGMTDDEGKLISNRIPDISEWKSPSAKADAKAKEISFYVEWADNTPEGASVVKELDYCKRMSSENMVIDDIPDTWKRKYGVNQQEIDKRKKYLEGRRGTVRKAYKDAARLLVQLDMVNSLDGVTAEIGDEDDNTILVKNKVKVNEWKFYSVGAFLKLNPLKASEKDGSYADLEATAKRDTATQTKTTGLQLNAVATPESSDKVATVWHSYLVECLKDKRGDQYAALIRHLGSDGGRQALLTMSGIAKSIKAIMSVGNLQSIADIEEEKIRQLAA